MGGVGGQQEATDPKTRRTALMDFVWADLNNLELIRSWVSREDALVLCWEALDVFLIRQIRSLAVCDFQKAIRLYLGHHGPILGITEKVAFRPVVFIIVLIVRLANRLIKEEKRRRCGCVGVIRGYVFSTRCSLF